MNETKVTKALAEHQPKERVSISRGNTKLGAIPSVSFPPIKSFYYKERICVKCECNKDCYAFCHIYRIQKQPAISYEDNYYTWKTNPNLFFRSVEATCMVSRSFRWFVSGDIPDYNFFEQMVRIAKNNPHCEQICFTKKYDIVNEWLKNNGEIPSNLHLIFSAWKKLPMVNPYMMPECHLIYKDGTITASDNKTSYLCSGNCTECFCERKNCFTLKKNEQILIKQH